MTAPTWVPDQPTPIYDSVVADLGHPLTGRAEFAAEFAAAAKKPARKKANPRAAKTGAGK